MLVLSREQRSPFLIELFYLETECKKMEIKISEHQLTRREVEILYTMWNAGRPLMASEIADANEELKIATVHTTLKRMLKNNLVEVANFAKSGNVYGRCYQPTMNLKDFELDKMVYDFKKKQSEDITTSNLVAALLDTEDDKTALEELDELEKLIQQK